MSDIVERIRSLRFVHIPGTSDLMEEACQEIERLRNGAAESRETVRLTDEEREAVEAAVFAYSGTSESVYERIADTLRKLLERLT